MANWNASGHQATPPAALDRAVIRLHTNGGRLKGRLCAGVAKGVLDHLRQPAAESNNRRRELGHGAEGETSSMEKGKAAANENLRGFRGGGGGSGKKTAAG